MRFDDLVQRVRSERITEENIERALLVLQVDALLAQNTALLKWANSATPAVNALGEHVAVLQTLIELAPGSEISIVLERNAQGQADRVIRRRGGGAA